MIVVVAGWMVGVAVGVAVAEAPEELLDELVLLEVVPLVLLEDVPLDTLVVEAATSALASVGWPEYETAASDPKAPTAATPAIVVPSVSARIRATARFRSAGVVRLAAFMAQVSRTRPFARITAIRTVRR